MSTLAFISAGRTLGLAVALALTPLGCGAFDDFEVELEDAVSVPSGKQTGVLSPLPYDGKLTNFSLSQDQSFANQGVEPGDVDAIFVKRIQLTDSQPGLHNFKNILDEVVLSIESPNLPKQELARGSSFADAATVELVVNGTLNLKPYAEAASMKISADVKLKQTPMFAFKIQTLIVLLVDINLLGT